MNSDPRAGSDTTRRHSRARARDPQQPPPDDEELETGEPIPGEGEPIPSLKKIPALRGNFSEKPSGQPETGNSSGGQVVLSTAKYLKTSPDRADNRKGKGNSCEGDDSDQSLEGRVLNGGVWGGMLAMAVAVIWFIGGLMCDVFFFYPPILFVLGLVAFCKAPSQR